MAALAIRPATPADATHLACFVDMASEGLALHLWEKMRQPGQTLFEVGRSRALREEGSFSYRNAHMAEVEGAVAGALVGYQIAEVHDRNLRTAGEPDAPPLPEFVQVMVELESMAPLHWYVNILATYPEYRGRGIGKALLAHADKLGAAMSAKGMALVVASENEGARRQYEKAGYRETARRSLVAFPGFDHGGDWVLMTKASA